MYFISLSVLFALAISINAAPVDEDAQPQSTSSYDYIIVGGGTAGLTLASRLSENPKISVAVIEAGTYHQITNPLLSQTPAGDVVFVGSSPLDNNPLNEWSFVTTPQTGANGRSIHYTQGKCLGGSSARNFMIYQRATRQSLQKWADAVGDQSWTFDNMLPYYKKSIKFTPPSSKRAPNATAQYNPNAFSSSGGPHQVSYANYGMPFSSWLQPSLNEIGVPTVQDFNSGSLLGCQYCSSTISPEKQFRESSQTSFLNAASSRPNLKVFQLTIAQKVLFDKNKKATGVLVQTLTGTSLGLPFIVSANKEVIISSGAFRSPQLLIVSGIGPKDQLASLGVTTIAERPGVGQNMWDHVFFGPAYRVKVETFTKLANDPVYVGQQFLTSYSLKQEGPLTNPVADFLGWEKVPRNLISSQAAATLNANFPPDWPEMEYLTAPGYVGDFASLLLTQPKDGYQYATILGGLITPLSRGTVTVTSKDTTINPAINPNWLTDSTDKEVAVAMYKRLRAAFTSSAMSGVLADPKEYFPGPDVQTDEQILKTIQNTVMTIWHPSCSNKMGKPDDPMAVVDSNAKVIGVSGLRVVDASSFAILPPGHPQSMIFAFAEKIAAQILAAN